MPRRRRNAVPMPRQNDERLSNPPPGQRQQQQQNLQNVSAAEADDSTAVALSIPASVCSPPSVPVLTNLDHFMKSVSPRVPLQNLSEVNSKGSGRVEMDSHFFFSLEDLWESFKEWSVYGVGVPLLLNGKDPIEQFYIPYLSGIQLFRDTPRCSSQLRASGELNDAELYNPAISAGCSSNSRAGNESVSGSTGDLAHSSRTPFFQYFEYESPYQRPPLTDKIWELASQYPELITHRSCDLLPTSWICVAWYPIYRIPVVPKLQHLEASFLTFYSLSTQSKNMQGNGDPDDKYELPVFGLVSQKFRGSMMSSCGTQEREQESSLLQAAEDWMGQLNVMLPDYRYFRVHDRTR